MLHLASIPLRQKTLIAFTIISGLLLLLFTIFSGGADTLHILILFYSIINPLSLLMLNTVIDLNDNNVFRIWLLIALVLFAVSLMTNNSPQFMIRRHPRYSNVTGFYKLIIRHSTSSLKSLLVFLLAYWPLNKLMNKKGAFIINTFRQSKWYHEEAQRKITGLDVLINSILYFIIVIACIFGH